MRAAPLITALALALLAPLLAAQRAKLLPAEQVSTGGKHADLARAADLTGDGVPEIVATRNLHTTSFEQPGLVVLSGLQGGSEAGRFVVHSFTAGPRQPWFAIGDVNGDGLPDVISSKPPIDSPSNNPPEVLVFLETPDGTLLDPLASPISNLSGEQTGDLRLADFDEDGELDVAIVAGKPIFQSTTPIRVGLGHGDGSFGAFTTTTPAIFDALDVADVNGDGHIDLVSGDGPVTLLGHGDGSFGTALAAPPPGGDAHVTLGDLDGSGSLDYVGVGSSYSGVAVRPGQPSGAFGSKSDLLLAPGGYPSEVSIRDFDADGRNDIVAALPYGDFVQPQSGSLEFWRGLGGLAFAPVEELPVGSSPNSLDFADLDGDGLQDVLFGQQYFNDPDSDPTSGAATGVAILFRRAAPAPSQTLAQAFGGVDLHKLSDRALRIGSGDLDGDGHADVLALLKHSQVDSLLGGGDGSLGPATAVAVPGLATLAFDAQRLHLADLDGDGLCDLLLSGNGAWGQLAALSLGDGEHFAAPALFGSGNVSDELLVDADADGALDVIAAMPLSNEIDVHLGAGDGSFGPALATPLAGLPRAVAAADFDADGLPDLAVAVGGLPQLALLLGAGAGAFRAPTWIDAPETPTALAFIDLDEDEAPELVTLATGPELDLRAGLGGGAFGPPQPAPLGAHATALLGGDLDRDGRTDLLALVPGRDAVVFLGGDGAGGLLPAVGFGDGFTPLDALLADLDADGFLDLVSVARFIFLHDAVLVQLGQSATFADLGYAKPGPAGAPKLTGSGLPVPGAEVSFLATGVPAPAPGFLLVGLDTVHAPFLGGTLVPVPTIALPMRPDVPLAGRWPPLSAGTAAYAQGWFAAGATVATNALVIVSQ